MDVLINWLGFNRLSFKKVFTNFNWLILDQILRIVVGFVVSIFFVRKFSVEEYGAYNYAVAFMTFFSTISNLSADQIIINALVASPKNKNKIVGTSVCIKLIAAIFSMIVSVIMITVLRPRNELIFYLNLLFSISFVFQSFYVFDLWFQSKLWSKYSVIAKDIAFLIVALLKIFLLTKNVSILSFAFLFSFEYLLSAVGLWFFYMKKNKNARMIVDWKLGKKMLKVSWPLTLSGLAVLFYMKSNQILLGNMLGDRAVGIYSLAVMFSEFWYFVPMSLCNSVFPHLIKYKKINLDLYELRKKQFVRFLFILSVIAIVTIAVLSKYLILWVYGEKYIESAGVLSVLIWSGIAVSMGLVAGQLLVIDKLTKLSLWRTIIGAGVNVILALILIPRLGVYGAAISALVGYFVAVYSVFLFKDGRKSCSVLLNFWKRD